MPEQSVEQAMDSSSFETIPMQEDRVDAIDEVFGTTVLLPDGEASLSSQVIADYFTSDGPRARRLDSSDYERERSIMDESSGDEDLRQYGEVPTQVLEPETTLPQAYEAEVALPKAHEMESSDSPVVTLLERTKWMLEKMLTWKVVLSVLTVILALAHCIWMWNLVELSALSLEFGD